MLATKNNSPDHPVTNANAMKASDPVMISLARSLNMTFVDLELTEPLRELVAQFPANVLFRDKALPIDRCGERVRIAISDPYKLETLNELEALTGIPLEAVLAEPRQIEAKLHQVLGVAGGTVSDLIHRSNQAHSDNIDSPARDDDDSSDASVIRLVNELLCEAITQGASDVHIEPRTTGLDVRFRVDGQLRTQPIPEELHRFRAAIVSRLKIMSRLNIAEKRVPQDGRMKINLQNRDIDIRISVIPMLYGEGVVLRLLDQSRAAVELAQMQFPTDILNRWKRIIRRPNGMILVTGPTGSGKTTTLYASLSEIKDNANKIITIEDPVEYHLNGISQIQVHSKVGLSFAAGLRSILRHDPDVVLIGEIRDVETATSAVQASLTGHLVFSTLHTNDAASAFTRLIDMGVEPYLVASTVHAVLAQRLVRRLCNHCKTPIVAEQSELPSDLQIRNLKTIFQPTGCRKCHGTGYRGRTAIFELLETNSQLRKLCTASADALAIRQTALATGMVSLRESGWQLVEQGETTVDEILRAAADEDCHPQTFNTLGKSIPTTEAI